LAAGNTIGGHATAAAGWSAAGTAINDDGKLGGGRYGDGGQA
jgi:hypothetical protein